MKLVFNIKNDNSIVIQLKKGKALVDQETLTIGRGLDMLLIKTLDNIIIRNKIDRLSLSNIGIKGKIDGQALWGMVLKTVKTALEN